MLERLRKFSGGGRTCLWRRNLFRRHGRSLGGGDGEARERALFRAVHRVFALRGRVSRSYRYSLVERKPARAAESCKRAVSREWFPGSNQLRSRERQANTGGEDFFWQLSLLCEMGRAARAVLEHDRRDNARTYCDGALARHRPAPRFTGIFTADAGPCRAGSRINSREAGGSESRAVRRRVHQLWTARAWPRDTADSARPRC